MLRSGARCISRALRPSASIPQLTSRHASSRLYSSLKARPATNKLALSVYKPLPTALLRYASTAVPGDDIDLKREEKIGEKKMRAHPERVSAESTTHPMFHEVATKDDEENVDMMAGIRQDLVRNDSRAKRQNIHNLIPFIENDQEHIHPRRSPPRCPLSRHGRCHPIPRNIAVNRLSSMGSQPRRSAWGRCSA